MTQLELDTGQAKAILTALETQRNVLENTDVATETERKRLDVELEWLQNHIKISTGVDEGTLKDLL